MSTISRTKNTTVCQRLIRPLKSIVLSAPMQSGELQIVKLADQSPRYMVGVRYKF